MMATMKDTGVMVLSDLAVCRCSEDWNRHQENTMAWQLRSWRASRESHNGMYCSSFGNSLTHFCRIAAAQLSSAFFNLSMVLKRRQNEVLDDHTAKLQVGSQILFLKRSGVFLFRLKS